MSYSFSELITRNFNANSTSSFTDSLDTRENTLICFGTKSVSGTHSSHVLTLQHSLDNATWEDTAYTLTGGGIKDGIQTAVRWHRVRCSTAKGVASLMDVTIQAK